MSVSARSSLLPIPFLLLAVGCTSLPDSAAAPVTSASFAADASATDIAPTSLAAANSETDAALSSMGAVRYVPPPKLFDKAFRDASAEKHAEDIARLTQAFLDLGPGVDPEEAARAARAVYTYVDQLVIEYEIEDPPLTHNTKVNLGLKPRGLCWHWAHDIDKRLQMERFKTLQIHRAIANYNNFRLEHSTTIVYGPLSNGCTQVMYEGVPNYPANDRFWEIVEKDTRYNWTPRDEVFAYKRALKARKARKKAAARLD